MLRSTIATTTSKRIKKCQRWAGPESDDVKRYASEMLQLASGFVRLTLFYDFNNHRDDA